MSVLAPINKLCHPDLVDVAAPRALPTPPPKRTKRRACVLVALILLIAAAIWGGRWWLAERYIESTDDAYLQADSMTVTPKVSGYAAEVYVGDNQLVTAGQPLVRLDSQKYAAVLAQATAMIAARKADITRGEADLLLQQSSIDQAKAQLDGAKSGAAYANERVERYAPLVSKGAETVDRLAELRNTRSQAGATLAANMAALQAAQRQTGSTKAQIQQARAQLEAAEATARHAQLDMQDTVVRSTLAGRIGDRAVRAGQYVQPGTRMMTIIPVQDIYLVANFKETQIGRMRVGQPVTITVDALSGTELHGKVDSFSPGTGSQFALLPAQNATGNFTKIVQRVSVRIRLDTDQQIRKVLIPGLSATVHVNTRSEWEAKQQINTNSNTAKNLTAKRESMRG